MSAPIADDLLREFDAERRRFRSARHALLWYRAVRARKMPHAASMEPSSASRRAASTAATYARIALCLAPWHAADEERDESLALNALFHRLPRNGPEAIAEADRRVAELVAHMVAPKGWQLTDALDLESEQQTSAHVAYAERVIWRRMRAEGLLDDS